VVQHFLRIQPAIAIAELLDCFTRLESAVAASSNMKSAE